MLLFVYSYTRRLGRKVYVTEVFAETTTPQHNNTHHPTPDYPADWLEETGAQSDLAAPAILARGRLRGYGGFRQIRGTAAPSANRYHLLPVLNFPHMVASSFLGSFPTFLGFWSNHVALRSLAAGVNTDWLLVQYFLPDSCCHQPINRDAMPSITPNHPKPRTSDVSGGQPAASQPSRTRIEASNSFKVPPRGR